ncbi:roadblock/LC7 domain-containing protein [Streptomyces sp. NBC_00820]|uniref:roadblock/LC7 domain-containing protein n=1 Tax=Streptomyces sp. NBC_00820 TaxID=2975842 RepID=UPI002ED1F382|nr:roadblock/LC7 domain-containing protein [Streptomyces sp. NBC_00820]
MTSSVRPDLSWIVDNLVQFPHARHAVVLSSDGLPMVASQDVEQDLADQISATASGLQSLSRNAARFVGDETTPWQQTMVSYRGGFLFIIAAGNGCFLVASADSDVDIAAFSYQMTDVVKRLGTELSVGPRQLRAEHG